MGSFFSNHMLEEKIEDLTRELKRKEKQLQESINRERSEITRETENLRRQKQIGVIREQLYLLARSIIAKQNVITLLLRQKVKLTEFRTTMTTAVSTTNFDTIIQQTSELLSALNIERPIHGTKTSIDKLTTSTENMFLRAAAINDGLVSEKSENSDVIIENLIDNIDITERYQPYSSAHIVTDADLIKRFEKLKSAPNTEPGLPSHR